MNLAEFHFIRPYWLVAFIPYLVILMLVLRNKLSQGHWAEVCDDALLPYLLQEKPAKQNRWFFTAGLIAAFLTIVSLAGPTWQRLPTPVFRNDSALVIALDLSRSMEANDIKPSRLIRARYKIADILKQRKDGQTALLVYAGAAFTVTPLTNDTETIASQLEALTTDIVPSQGSNTAEAINKAADLFKQSGLQNGRIILVTDAVDLPKTLPAVEALNGYKLSILGVGTVDGAPIALTEGGFLKDRQGNIVVAKLNESDLKTLAKAGNGIYQSITPDDADTRVLLSKLDQPAAQTSMENQNMVLDQWSDSGPWLLLPIIPLAAVMFRKGLLCFLIVFLLPLPKNGHAREWKDLWQTKDQQAQQAYQNKQYEQAAKLFDNAEWKAAAQYKAGQYDKSLESLKNSRTANSDYNLGNALAQSGQLEAAIKAYEKALSENPADEDAKYNKELVEQQLKKQKQQQNQQKKPDQTPPESDSDQKKDSQQNQSESSEDQKNTEQQEKNKPSEAEQSSAQQEQQSDAKDQKPAKENNPEQVKQPEQNDEKKALPKEAEQSAAEEQPSDEVKQANEQWLKRIPDDPAGLLKRKFRYQYSEQRHPSNTEAESW